jgi:hypothetical protein
VPANEPVDPVLVPRVKPDELAQRGSNELVAMVVPLGDLDGGEVMAEIRGLFGPFGNAASLSRSNQLLIQDTVGNLKRVLEALKEMESKQPKKEAAKTWALDLRDQSWPAVFDWLREQTTMPVVTQAKPAGTFTFSGPENRTYTLPEIVDILNEALGCKNSCSSAVGIPLHWCRPTNRWMRLSCRACGSPNCRHAA